MTETSPPSSDESIDPKNSRNKLSRAGLNALSGAIPVFGGLLSAAAGVWSENEQEQALSMIRAWLKMLEDEIKEKQDTLVSIIARLDMHDEEIQNRVKSDDYQRLLKKAFRNWSGTESKKKQEYIRNILSNAASVKIVTDDVVNLFLDWLQNYSEFHFAVVGEIYRNKGSTRGEVWINLGKEQVREDSAEADLFKLLVRDLSTGGIIRQHRETDYFGNFIPKAPARQGPKSSNNRTMKSAFDDTERYELTALGDQFVHYAMTEITVKIAYQTESESAVNDDE